MHTKQLNITQMYHFLAEGIIIYLALLPFNFYHYGNVSVWAYLGVLFGVGVVYSFITRITTRYVPYIVIIPIVFLLYYMIGYPHFLSFIFSGLFAWRYIALGSKGYLDNESTYFAATFLLTTLGIIIMRSFDVVILFIAQIIVVLLGFTFSNLLVIEKENRWEFHKTEWFKLGGFFLGIVTLIYLFSDTLHLIASKFWSGIGGGITLFAGGIARLFELLGLSNFFKKGFEQMDPMDENPGFAEGEIVEMQSFEPSKGEYFNLLLAISIGAIILFLVFVIYKGLKFRADDDGDKDPMGYNLMQEEVETSHRFFGKAFKRNRLKPNHPIRKLVYEFERTTAKSKLGRMRHESIENWFERIGLEGDIQIYQKVRYGNQSTSAQEEELLKRMLKTFEHKLPKNKDKA
ncbi:hypothetical protein [Paucisalibacillus globulus]|uniref:hypothetical protein n=1 Tax=Paucisalibacillus globulus TaxID=351095 RepID=UPI00040A6BF5|nr:hypothetical protein [Paucisalibacillus globulus]